MLEPVCETVDRGRSADRRRPDCGQHLARVPVRHGGEDRRSRSHVLVSLSGNEPGAHAGRQVLHGEKQELGRLEELDRLGMRPVPVEAHERIWRRHLLVLGRGRADEMYLDLIPQARVALEDAIDGLKQIEVGPCEELDLRHGHAPEQPSVPARLQLPEPDVRVQVSRVDDAEDAVLARCGSSGEIVGIKSVRDRDHGPAAELRERVQQAGHSLRRVHDDGCRLPQR